MLPRRLIRRFGSRPEAQTLGLFGVKNLIHPSDFDSLTDRAIHRCNQLRYTHSLTHSLTHLLTHSLTQPFTAKGSHCFFIARSNKPRPGVRAVDSSGPSVQLGLQHHRRRTVMHECSYEPVVSDSRRFVVW